MTMRSHIIGLGLLLLSMVLALSLLSYHHADPSWNHTYTGATHNWMGSFGAYSTDVLLQLFGLASGLLCLWCAVMGWRLLRRRGVRFPFLRFTVLLAAILPACAFLASLEAPLSWPLETGLGGWVGFVFHQRLFVNVPDWLLGMVGFLLMMPLIWLAMLRHPHTEAVAVHAETEEADDTYRPTLTERMQDGLYALLAVLPRPSLPTLRLSRLRQETADAEREEDAPSEPVKPRKQPRIAVGKAAADSSASNAGRTPPKVEARTRKAAQSSLSLAVEGDYNAPSLNLMTTPPDKSKHQVSQQALQQNARLLESTLADFGVKGTILNIRPGPVVTLYELEPAPGTKSARIIGLADDIARSMSAVSARISVIPGMNAIGIELPNQKRETVYFREMLESEAFQKSDMSLPMSLGHDIGGAPQVVDLAKMPHLLVAGTTGSGKSVGVNAMILSLLYKLSPEQCKFIMVDPKMLELSIYDGIPHLLCPVVTEPGKAVVALKWAVKEMEDRYRLMSNLGVRNITGYNKRIKEAQEKGESLTRRVQTGFDPETGRPIIEEIPLDMNPLPYIVIIVDEMADLMLVAGKDIEGSIQRLAQMARAAGLHLIMATQRPSVDVITGVIKANFPTRISFQVTSKIDSRTILGEQGAEQLLGMGDMLYMSGGSRITRIHGPFVSDQEVDAVVKHLKTLGEPTYISAVTEGGDDDEAGGEADIPGNIGGGSGEEAELYRKAVEVVVRDKKPSTSYVQRRLKIGYNKAASLIERMEQDGVISAPNHVGKREILLGRDED